VRPHSRSITLILDVLELKDEIEGAKDINFEKNPSMRQSIRIWDLIQEEQNLLRF
jgi:hypothetical protein